MQIIDLSHNDNLETVVQKCNLNFKELAFSANQSLKKQSRLDNTATQQEIDTAVYVLVTTAVPNAVSSQIASLDIPGQISTEVATQISAADIPGTVALAITAADIPGLVSAEVAAQIGTDYTTVVSDFITADSDVVITNGMAHRWGKIAKISLTYRLANSYSVMSDGKLNNLDMGVLTSDWMTVGGLTNINMDSTYNIQGVIDNNGRVAFMSANSRGTSYTIDQNAVLYAGFTYILA